MKKYLLNKAFIIFSGSVFITTMFYICYQPGHPQIIQQQRDNTTNEILSDDNSKFANILSIIRSYLQEQVFKYTWNNNSPVIALEDDNVPDLNPSEIFDLSPAEKRPQPATIPVTTTTEECLPYMKNLSFQPVNDHGEQCTA